MAENEKLKNEAVFIYTDEFERYKFTDDHPFNPLRIRLAKELLEDSAALKNSDILIPRIATDQEILAAHSEGYVEFIKSLGQETPNEEQLQNYGLADDDMGIFKEMHRAGAIIAGATLSAVETVIKGRALHALNLGGGLHHALYGKASGFCIYNDTVIAVKSILDRYDVKVLYVDTDAHHGDGVQWAFYDDTKVCTLSIHETGRYLFPGTGSIAERGSGQGLHYTFNIPVDAFTEDESWLECYTRAVEEVARYFKPDLLITQNGADGHYYDPLSHLYLTSETYKQIPAVAHRIAHEYCGGRWVALGGGGYDIFRVVPRSWARIWLEMTGFSEPLIDIPEAWLQKWRQYSSLELPRLWDDPKDLYDPIPRKSEITYKNKITLRNALNILGDQKIGNTFLS